MRIAMVTHMSGGRYDNTPWPPPGVPFEVPDWEGEGLVYWHHAIEVAPEPPPPPEPSALKQDWVDYAGDRGVDEPEDMTKAELRETVEGLPPEPVQDQGPQHGDPVPPEPPKPADPKQAWIDYAVSQGMTEDEAGPMTKADLMSRFGGRL